MIPVNKTTSAPNAGNQKLRSRGHTGKTVGIVLLLQLASALMLPFILSKAITFGSPRFLNAVAADATQIRMAVLISFVGAACTIFLGIAIFPVFNRYKRSVALLFLTVCAISATLDLVQGGTILSMLSLSEQFAALKTVDAPLYNIVGAAVAAARRSAHIVQLVGIAAWMFIFYASLLRLRLLPRPLAVLGCIGVLSQFMGVTLMMLLGYPVIGEMAMPLLPIQITVAVFLMARGFGNPPATSLW